MFGTVFILAAVGLFWVTLGAIEIRNNQQARTKIHKEIAFEGGRVHSITALNPMGNLLPFLVRFETSEGRLMQGTMYYMTKEKEAYWVGSLVPLTMSTTPGYVTTEAQQFEHLNHSFEWAQPTDSKEQIISDLSAEIERLRKQLNPVAA